MNVITAKQNFWKTIVVVFALYATASLQAQTHQQLAVFDGTNGSAPQASVIQGTDGNFYGTTKSGGVGDCPDNCGVIFKMTPSGELTTLYEFFKKGGFCPDGYYPVAALLLGKDGNFYGTTSSGGTIPAGDSGVPSGTVFKIALKARSTKFVAFVKPGPAPMALRQSLRSSREPMAIFTGRPTAAAQTAILVPSSS
jgi:uncharacterized repeat protein (TIGR03803 family)